MGRAGLALASALKHNTTLKVLDLTHNNILYNGTHLAMAEMERKYIFFEVLLTC
jgi:hypothetical protein